VTVTQAPPAPATEADDQPPRRWWRLPRLRADDEPPKPAPQRVPLSSGTVAAIWVMVSCAGLALWIVAFAAFFSALQANGAQKQLYAQIREQLALGTAALGGQIKPGAPVAVLSIPALGMDKSVIVEGTTSGLLRNGPGHLPNSVLPGQAGVSVIYGKSVTYGAPFRNVTALHAGDTIGVTTGQGTFTYRVDDVRRTGDPLPPVLTDGQGRLTLVAAESLGWQRGWAITSTVFIDASLQGKVAPTPAGRPASVPASEQPMAIDTSALIPLVFLLQLLLVVAAIIVWARLRWGGWQTWMVGLPVLLAVVWGTTNTALALVPNLL
jgi:sortase A